MQNITQDNFMSAKKLTFDANGRIAIPAKMRKLLHLNSGMFIDGG